MQRQFTISLAVYLLCGWMTPALAQEGDAEPPGGTPPVVEAPLEPGFALPNSDRLRVTLSGMFGYTFDPAQAPLGYDRQARPGYLIIGLSGRLNASLRYVASINPVMENEPLPACGEDDHFFPNTPQNFGPNVACHNDGRMRVDDYRFIALDPVIQSGPIREAYLEYAAGGFRLKGGRFILPVGFAWEEAGSYSAKDAPHIQRINAEANSGFQLALGRGAKDGRRAEVSAAGVLGDGNKFSDYAYFYFINGSLDSNSWLTMVVSGTVVPARRLEVRGAIKRGHTGSKVERLPNFYASKRYDHSTVVSARYDVTPYVRVLGELARYRWGLVETSAQLLDLPYRGPVEKNGYWAGVEASYPVRPGLRFGGSVVREELGRDDSLTQHLASQELFGVTMGKKERAAILRFHADIAGVTRLGVFYNAHSNPFPWVSGIAPVAGERAYQVREGARWGVIVRFAVP